MGEKDKVKAGHRKNKIKYSVGDHIFQAINYAVFTLITLICVYPFYYIVINTISDNKLVDLGRVMFYPIGIHFDNYVNIMKLPNMGTGAINSVARTVIGTVLGTLITSYMAYLFTKEELWGRKVWYRLTVATMYFSAGLIPGYLNIKMLGLMNTFWVYIIPNLISVYNMVLVKTYIESLPASLEESAQIDGAGYFRRFAVIVLPLCVPILATDRAVQRGGALEQLYGLSAVHPVAKAVYAAIYPEHVLPAGGAASAADRQRDSERGRIGVECADADIGEADGDGGDHSADPAGVSLCAEVFCEGDHGRSSERVRKVRKVAITGR